MHDHGDKAESGEILAETGDRQVRIVAWAGLLANLLLSIFKIAAGIFGNSRAVTADGVHSLSDITTDVAIIVGMKYWSAPPDPEHPHGHRRIETLISLFIGLVLAVVGIGIAHDALDALGKESQGPPKIIALAAALLSIVSKEILYQWTVRVGKSAKSSAVVANAWHHRSDGLSSIPAALAVGGAILLPEFGYLDTIGAVVVTVFILNAAWKIAWPAVHELTDRGASPRAVADIMKISKNVPGVETVHMVRTRRLGAGIEVDLHVKVDRNLSVHEGHEIAESVKRKLIEEGPSVVDVITHLEPYSE